MGMTASSRTARSSNLTTVYCEAPSLVRAAEEGDGRYPVKLPSGHVVVFGLEGDYLSARVTDAQRDALRGFAIFEIDGEPRTPDTVTTPVKSWMDEGARLFQEKLGRGPSESKPSSMLAEFAAIVGQDKVAALMSEILGSKMQEAATAVAEQRLAEQAARDAAHSTEFNFARLAQHLSDDDVAELFARHLPERDPTALSSGKRLVEIGQRAQTDAALAAALRELLA